MNAYGVIFDLDGTLADTLPDLADSVNFALTRLGYAASSKADVRRWVGEGLPVLCRRALADERNALPDEATVQNMVKMVTDHYRVHRLDKTTAYPGIPELLDGLTARSIAIAVLTNKPHEHTKPIVDALLGRWSWLAIEGYREEQYRKPDPRMALELVGRMGLPPSQVMMVGDSATDIHTGRNAGMITVGVSWGFRDRPELIEAGADHIINHPLELLPLL